MPENSKVSATKQQVLRVIHQAKESLKILGTLEKETLAKAKTLVKIPNAEERRRLTNDRILASLRKLGVATQSELDDLYSKIRKLENTLSRNEKAPAKKRTKSSLKR